ncbi:hypothetical protein [Aeromonas sobria]|uniref:hypothetical protein n=1 Tax=Aeromonas sobria TaxID=646 RepID=UPI001116EFD4|nr:hypothetical protein [Aeromonas sobria]TNH80972.1 hypothetical protein CF140_14890 [Aeromonas sobria]
MTTINNMVAEATAQRDRIFAAAAIMTVNQTYMAAVTDEGLMPSPEAIGEAVAKLTELAAEPVHGKRQWMFDHAWTILVSLLPTNVVMEDGEDPSLLVNNSFPLVLARFKDDFEDNLRIAERC